jgi:ubiquinone/menaquinone biosynthesis C-methylase UbiE
MTGKTAPDPAFLSKTRQSLFNGTAPHYDLIMPAFGPLVQTLIDWAELQADDSVIDLGTGTGAAVLPAARRVAWAAGIDFAAAMLLYARRNTAENGLRNLLLYQGDMARIPHRSGTFSVALTSFGFNGIDPKQVLPEVSRILQPGGRLLALEWGGVDEAGDLVRSALETYRVERPAGLLADLRRLRATPRAWDKTASEEKLTRLLRRSGFQTAVVKRDQAAVPLEPLAFFRYETAWLPYQAELEAMPAEDRTAMQTTVLEQLQRRLDEEGRFVWRPELLRIRAST